MTDTEPRRLVKAELWLDATDYDHPHWRERTTWSDGCVEEDEWFWPVGEGRKNIFYSVIELIFSHDEMIDVEIDSVVINGLTGTWEEPSDD